ncbi:MAG: hypothetical protein ACXAC7_03280 [Candidatus Hodarchaeales archaeon]|jgi:hypothetical protein
MQSLSTVSEVNPFASTTCRADKPPLVDILQPKKPVLTSIERNLQEVIALNESRIIPILGSAGSGKTSLYWSLRKLCEGDARIVYMSPQTSEHHANSIYTQLWFNLIEQLGDEILQEVSSTLKRGYGPLEKAISQFTGQYAIIIEMLYAYAEEKYHTTTKFLFSGLKVPNPILPNENGMWDDELCFAGLKLILHFSSRPVVFYFDEIESLFVSYGDQPEIRLLEKIKRIYNELNNSLIILSSLPQIWDRILSLSTVSAVSRFENPSIISRFTNSDLEALVSEHLHHYWSQRKIDLEFPSPIWPFKKEELTEIHSLSDGNPRDALKALRAKWYDYYDEIQKFLAKKLNL